MCEHAFLIILKSRCGCQWALWRPLTDDNIKEKDAILTKATEVWARRSRDCHHIIFHVSIYFSTLSFIRTFYFFFIHSIISFLFLFSIITNFSLHTFARKSHVFIPDIHPSLARTHFIPWKILIIPDPKSSCVSSFRSSSSRAPVRLKMSGVFFLLFKIIRVLYKRQKKNTYCTQSFYFRSSSSYIKNSSLHIAHFRSCVRARDEKTIFWFFFHNPPSSPHTSHAHFSILKNFHNPLKSFIILNPIIN